jgi:pimeloyl-ACP methyl ester carboxylesterase
VFEIGTAMRVFVAAIALAALPALSVNPTAQTGGYTPGWEPTPCKHTLAAGSTTLCGYLIVPERREAPTGPMIKVYHVIMPAQNGSKTEIPVMYVTGGPGASTAGAVELFELRDGPAAIFRQKFGDKRDLIIIDQRGTNQSIPALYCGEELGSLRPTVYTSDFAPAASLRVQALGNCRERWIRQGVNLSGYDDYEVAADVRDILTVRGIRRVNLYGASWGTRVTMQVMKLYPEIVNAVVIDSILPPELNPFVAEVQGTQHGIQALIDSSRSTYPQLESYINTILQRLRAAPVRVVGHQGQGGCSAPATGSVPYVVNVTGDKFIDYLASQLRTTPYCTNLPKVIKAMFDQQRYEVLADSWISSVDYMFAAGGPADGAPAIAMFQSAFAANDAFYARPSDVLENIKQRVTDPSLAYWLENSFIYREPSMMRTWPVDPLPASVRLPVVSSIPTLMLVGTLDVATPSIFSRPSEAGLSNHVYYEIVSGHATAYLPCVLDMLDAWLQKPGVAPGNGCQQTYTWDPPASTTSTTFESRGATEPSPLTAAGFTIERGVVVRRPTGNQKQ